VQAVAVLGQLDEFFGKLLMLSARVRRLGRSGHVEHAPGRIDEVRLRCQVVAVLIGGDAFALQPIKCRK
jgi:hypothetical protein